MRVQVPAQHTADIELVGNSGRGSVLVIADDDIAAAGGDISPGLVAQESIADAAGYAAAGPEADQG